MTELVKDPVCQMQVPAVSFAMEYTGIKYAFCSAQCRDRFLTNPHLYIGFPGHKAPAQKGVEIVKYRKISFDSPLDAAQAQQIHDALTDMMGVQEVLIDGDKLEIRYDLIQATEEQIESKLVSVGATLKQGWADRIRRALIHFREESEAGSLEVTKNKKSCH
ncbi:MAG: YHS domain-containing protein [Methylotenera sp.]|nr:YHS domain-containing protein [Methylotenera sp.]